MPRIDAGGVVAGVGALLLGCTIFLADALNETRLAWIGGAGVVLAAVAVAAVALGLLPGPRLGRAAVALLLLVTALVIWQAVSIAWSIDSDRSWSYANRGVAYLAFALVGVVIGGATPWAPRLVAGVLACALAAVLAWALAGKVFAFAPEADTLARLHAPLGYWNELALLGCVAIVLGLEIAGRRRSLGALLVYVAAVVVVLTYSRTASVLALAATAAWLARGPTRREALRAVVAAAPAVAAVAATGLLLPGVAKAAQPHSTRLRDGLVFGIVLVAGGIAAAAGARLLPALRARGVRLAAVGLAALVVAALAVAVARAGGPESFLRARWHEFANTSSSQIANEPGRFGSLSSSNRWRWWGEAWDAFVDDPVLGTGAGTFGTTDRIRRRDPIATIEPHNVPLQFLSETGLVGFALLAAAIAAAALAVRRRLRELAPGDRAAAVALALAALVWTCHQLGDIDWDFVAVQGPLFLVLGALAAAPGERRRARSAFLLAPGALLVAAAAAYSLAAPPLAASKVVDAYAAYERGDVARGVALARSARSLDPFSVDALTAWAQGVDPVRARALLQKAVQIAPKDARAWYTLAAFEWAAGRPRAAYVAANNSYTYDRFGPAGRPGSLLDRARCAIDPSTCRR